MSQNSQIYCWLVDGHTLTKAEAFSKGWGLSLNSRVAELREKGFDIDCRREERNGKPVWVYFLEKSTMEGRGTQATEAGQSRNFPQTKAATQHGQNSTGSPSNEGRPVGAAFAAPIEQLALGLRA